MSFLGREEAQTRPVDAGDPDAVQTVRSEYDDGQASAVGGDPELTRDEGPQIVGPRSQLFQVGVDPDVLPLGPDQASGCVRHRAVASEAESAVSRA